MDDRTADVRPGFQLIALAPVLYMDDRWRGAKTELLDFLDQPGARVSFAIAWFKERQDLTIGLRKRLAERLN